MRAVAKQRRRAEALAKAVGGELRESVTDPDIVRVYLTRKGERLVYFSVDIDGAVRLWDLRNRLNPARRRELELQAELVR
jgi:hypothetical protein